jgi:membrane-bound metal-dependent hydrolase YbcI (DUF457 family)
MAGFRVHLACAGALGVAWGGAAAWYLGLDWGPVLLGAGLTTLGGLLPDLDSDSGVPVRELFSLAAVATPLLLFHRVQDLHFTPEQTMVILVGLYLLVRYGVSTVFCQLTVHRGMFHSIPAMLIAGLAVYLLDHNPDPRIRFYLAGGVMIGFLSHLLLDEWYSVDFHGAKIRLNKYAGSAVKFASRSWTATAATYVVLLLLAALAWFEWTGAAGLPAT